MNTRIESFVFDSGHPGPALAMFGAVHGNETCGAVALSRLKARLEAGAIVLKAGRLTLVPVCNPEAHAAHKRFIDRNLNRRLYPKPPGERRAYEDHLDDQLCAILDKTDWLLDIHSYHTGGPPFVFIDSKDAETKKFGAALGVTRNFVWGWADAYRGSTTDEKESQGTTEYLRSVGGRGLTLECGQHRDPKNPDVATVAALNAMVHLGLIGADTARTALKGISIPPLGPPQYAKMLTVIHNTPATLARPFRHFEPVRAGEQLVLHADGRIVTAPADGYTILPHPEAPLGAEILYFAVDEEPLRESSPKNS